MSVPTRILSKSTGSIRFWTQTTSLQKKWTHPVFSSSVVKLAKSEPSRFYHSSKVLKWDDNDEDPLFAEKKGGTSFRPLQPSVYFSQYNTCFRMTFSKENNCVFVETRKLPETANLNLTHPSSAYTEEKIVIRLGNTELAKMLTVIKRIVSNVEIYHVRNKDDFEKRTVVTIKLAQPVEGYENFGLYMTLKSADRPFTSSKLFLEHHELVLLETFLEESLKSALGF